MIFAGRAGSTPAVTTLLTANNRNVFIMFPPDCVTASPVMYTAMVGINVDPSSRNFKLFFGFSRCVGSRREASTGRLVVSSVNPILIRRNGGQLGLRGPVQRG